MLKLKLNYHTAKLLKSEPGSAERSAGQREERRLAAIMFTDMVGYTSLAQTDEKKAMSLLAEYRSVVRSAVAEHRGREIKTIGDAFLLEFVSALEALRCASEIQRKVFERNKLAPEGEKILIRVGIHVGEVVETENDVYGDAVNVASRIEPLANPGGICFTAQVYDHVRDKTELRISKVGLTELKNVRLPMEIYSVVPDWEEGMSRAKDQLDRRRVAVLPFTNISADPSDEYFADGLTEEMISTLSKIRGLSVISRTSVMQYKSKTKPLPEIGRELNAWTILEGSVRKSGNRVRITVQMIDAVEDRHQWAESYDREIKDVFEVQSDIALRVADALKIELLKEEKKELEKPATSSPQAHTLYLKGLSFINRGTSLLDVMKGIEYLQLAVELDRNFALAYATMASAYVGIAEEAIAGSEAIPKAKEAAKRALEIDQNLAEAHVALGLIAFQYEWDWKVAEREFRTAMELNPSLAYGYDWYARLLTALGRTEEAIQMMKRAEELDPASPYLKMRFSGIYFIARQYEKAIEKAEQLLERQQDNPRALLVVAMNLLSMSKKEEAVKLATRAIEVSDEAFFFSWAALVFAAAGERERALEILNGLVSKKYRGYVPPFTIAMIYYRLGEKEKGFEWVRRAFDERSAAIPMTHNWPINEPAKDDERYLQMLKSVGL